MSEDRPRQFTPQMLIGLMVISIGVLFTLDNFGMVQDWDRHVLRYWPAGLLAIGLMKLWQSRDGMGGSFGGLLFTIAGGWLLLEQTTLIRISFTDLWPLLLVLFGGYLVWQGVAGPRPRAAGDSNATVNATAILGGITRGNNSRAFKGGQITAVMGGCELDLRQASIDAEAVFDVFALWGGIEIRVPDDWTVVSRVVPLLGGFADSTRPAQTAPAKRLVIRGFVIMAGVEVKN
jgi:hypothetical protein